MRPRVAAAARPADCRQAARARRARRCAAQCAVRYAGPCHPRRGACGHRLFVVAPGRSRLAQGDVQLAEPVSGDDAPGRGDRDGRPAARARRDRLRRRPVRCAVRASHTRSSQRGSTRANFQNNGLEPAAQRGEATIACFEEAGYDGYFAAEPPAGSHFKREIFLPQIVREVDHIIYLPRVSKHVLAGSTLGSEGRRRLDARRQPPRAAPRRRDAFWRSAPTSTAAARSASACGSCCPSARRCRRRSVRTAATSPRRMSVW